MVQLTTEQRVFVITTYTLTQSVTEEQNAFRIRFPDRNPPDKKTILKTFKNTRPQEQAKSAKREIRAGEELLEVKKTLLL